MTAIRSAMAKGAAWMVLARIADRLIGLVSMLVLARLLAPHDFGIVAMAMSFVALLELLTAFGFDTALVQKQAARREQLDTAWTYSVVFALGVAALIAMLCVPISRFFGEPDLADVLRLLALGFIAQGFQNVGIVAFRIDMQFDREFQFMVGKKLIGLVVVLPLAFWLQSYWALVIGQLATRIGGTALSYAMHPFRPRLSLAASGELFNFSKWLLASSWISYVGERSPDWILGRLLGPAAVGVFNIGSELSRLASTEISAPVNRAVFSGYAKLLEDKLALRREFLSVCGMVCLVACPAALGVGATAPLLVPALLGTKWEAAIPVIQVMSMFGLLSLLTGNAGYLYLALGRPDLTVKIGTATVLLQVVLMLLLSPKFGVVGTAAAYSLSLAVIVPVSVTVLRRAIGLTFREYVAATGRSVVAALAMFGLVSWTCARFVGDGPPQSSLEAIGPLLLAVVLGAVVYVGLVTAMWFAAGRPEGAEAILLRRIRARVPAPGAGDATA